MKASLLLIALLVGFVSTQEALAQGQVRWGNSFTGVTRAPVYGPDPTNPTLRNTGNTAGGLPAGTQIYGGALLQGTGFTIAMFFGNDQEPIGVNTFRTGTASGLTTLLTATDPRRPPGTTDFNVQFRVWDNQGGTLTSWAQALTMGSMYQLAGVSEPFQIGALGGVSGPNVFPVPDTIGIRSFNVSVMFIVPEPSLIALGALGLGALLLRRRK